MTSTPEPTVHTDSNGRTTAEPDSIDGTLRFAGAVQIAFTVVGGFLWMYYGLGVAMCSDGGAVAACNSLANYYGLLGLALLINLGGGSSLFTANNQPIGSRGRRAGIAFSVATGTFVLIMYALVTSAAGAIS